MGDRIVPGGRRSRAVSAPGFAGTTLKPLALLLAFGALLAACSPSRAGDRTIEVRIRHSAFVPERISVDPGTTVRFVVVNTDPIAHEFIVGDRRVQAIHEKGTEAHHGAKPGEISIPADSTAETTYRFDEAGTLIYGCHVFGHYDYGMRGTIEIR